MARFVLFRFLSTIPVLIVVSLVVFTLLNVTPGDPALMLVGDYATEAEIEAVRQDMGLDLPVHERFLAWAYHLATGNLGVSAFASEQVGTMILQRAEPTISLAIVTLLIAIPVALGLGTVAAWKAGQPVDRAVMTLSVIGFSMPLFILGYVLIYVFALKWQIVPVQGFVSIREGVWPFLQAIILPACTLSVIYLSIIARITRTSVLQVLGEDFIRSARARGAGEARVLGRHALRNAAIPIVTIIGVSVGGLLSGALVVESVFNLPGVGRLLVDAIAKRDYPVIQGIVVVFSFIYVGINLIVDVLYVLINPTVRY